jgi:hypothetical protein
MSEFRKKPIVINAIQYTGSNWLAVWDWHIALRTKFGDKMQGAFFERDDGSGVTVGTKEGQTLASPNDWIIRGVAGELYPCKPDIFVATYDAA